MYAIVEIKNSQFKVSEGDTIIVDKTNVESGKSIEFDKVLLFKTEKDVLIGKPYVANAKVKGKVIGEENGKKVVVYKFKRRHNYDKTKGHRQKYDKILIEKISVQ